MAKYINTDRLMAEIESYRKECEDSYGNPGDNDFPFGKVMACQEIIGIIDSLRREQPDVDLEKEIIRYQREDMDRDTTVGDVARHFYELGQKDAANKYDAGFKAGSRWLAEQGVSVEANIMDSSGSGYLSLIMPNNINNRYKFFNDGDRVIVQIRKK